MKYMIYKIKLIVVSLVLAFTFAINSAEARFMDHHPKIHHAAQVVKEDAKRVWHTAKKVCEEVLIPVQTLIAIATAISMGLL